MSKRKGAEVTTRTMVKRILFYFDQATSADVEAGSVWYHDARNTAQAMADATDYPLDVCAAVLSALSPQTTWQANVNGAWAFLTGATRPGGMLGANWARAQAVLTAHVSGADPLGPLAGGPKITAFALAILGDHDSVVVDVWASRVALQGNAYAYRDGRGDDVAKILGRAGVYEAVADAYRIAARRRGVTPCTMQATTWGIVRRRFV